MSSAELAKQSLLLNKLN